MLTLNKNLQHKTDPQHTLFDFHLQVCGGGQCYLDFCRENKKEENGLARGDLQRYRCKSRIV